LKAQKDNSEKQATLDAPEADDEYDLQLKALGQELIVAIKDPRMRGTHQHAALKASFEAKKAEGPPSTRRQLAALVATESPGMLTAPLFTTVQPTAGPVTLLGRIVRLELDTLGEESQKCGAVSRVEALEEVILGASSQGALPARVKELEGAMGIGQ